MNTSVFPRPLPDETLLAAVKIAVLSFEDPIDAASSPEVNAFGSWLHAVYLSIFTHVDNEYVSNTLLQKRISQLADQALAVLKSSEFSSVVDLAKTLPQSAQFRLTNLRIDSSTLFVLSQRLKLGPKAKDLCAWVDIAYGDKPKTKTSSISYFGIKADGSVYNNSMPVIEGFDVNDMPKGWMQLPPFWRVLYAASSYAKMYSACAQEVLDCLVSASALPMIPNDNKYVPFINFIAQIKELNLLFEPQSSDFNCQHLVHRLLQPWSNKSICGVRYAEEWLRWMESFAKDHVALWPNSFYKVAFLRFVNPRAILHKVSSLEALTQDADPNPPDKMKSPNPPDKMKDPNDDPASELEKPESDKKISSEESVDDEPFVDPAAATVGENKVPVEADIDNSIGDIATAPDTDQGGAYLYRRAVLALDDVLTRDGHIAVDQEKKEFLHQWCRNWLWLANVAQTQTLIKSLGLQSVLKPVSK